MGWEWLNGGLHVRMGSPALKAEGRWACNAVTDDGWCGGNSCLPTKLTAALTITLTAHPALRSPVL